MIQKSVLLGVVLCLSVSVFQSLYAQKDWSNGGLLSYTVKPSDFTKAGAIAVGTFHNAPVSSFGQYSLTCQVAPGWGGTCQRVNVVLRSINRGEPSGIVNSLQAQCSDLGWSAISHFSAPYFSDKKEDLPLVFYPIAPEHFDEPVKISCSLNHSF